MSGTTPGGWPYVTPDDHPKEYPAASQQLAEKLEAVHAKTVKGGLWGGTTDGNGFFMVPHGLGKRPTWATLTPMVATPHYAIAYQPDPFGADGSVIIGILYDAGGVPRANAQVQVSWTCGD